ncbi:MAG TPA: MFS transporter [Methylomirabilota bacterium]
MKAWRPGRVFYGWRIVGAGFGLEVLIGALLFHAYGAYVVLMREEFGWSRTLFSAVFAMARAESAVLGPVQGWLTDRFGPRALMRVGMTVFGLGFVLFSRIDSPLEFFLAFFLVAVGAGLGGYVPIAVAIVNWFKRRRALALGLASSGSAVGGLLTPVVVASLTTLGWRGTALLSGLLILVVGLLAAQVFRHRPEHYGEYPDGLPPADTGPSLPGGGPGAASLDFTPREAMRTAAFWLVSLGHGAALLVVSAVIVHMVTHVTERLGYSLAQAATVVALLTVAQIGGHLGGGWAGDRTSKRVIAAVCMVGHAVALLLLAWASAYWMVIAFAGLHGLSWGTRGPLMAAIRADYFGASAFGTISGVSSMVTMLGMMGGPLVAGILADRTGSYGLGFTVLALLALLGSVSFLLARRPPPPARPPVPNLAPVVR